ncbi:hypothetical protein WR25_01033 [Diploscapter pachys]|uniref:Major facilitator superfamily (MFS) profile domain-containing protein n=1 Tax=Diploscapter pachys TaxID=2018661 RepID=A0A2A2JT05_9BILA|nr:hypothetical protein WR25_01033 [Diploscapter pachys]
MKIENPKESSLEDEDPYLLDNVLAKFGATNPVPLYITTVMGSLWILGAMASMSPAYMSPSKPVANSTFETVQVEFNITKGYIDKGEFVSSAYFVGCLCMGQFYAILADRYGRRPLLVFSVIMSGIFGMLGSFSPTFSVVLVCRLMQGSFAGIVTITNWVMCAESIPFKSHGIASVFFGICWVLDKIIVDTQKLIEANVRVKTKDETLLQQLSLLVKDKHILLCTGMQCIIWAIDFCEYNALSLTATSVGGHNHHVSFIFSGLIELPSYFLVPPMIDWIGRKPSVIIAHLITSVSMFIMFFIDSHMHSAIFLILWLTAKFSISCAYMSCFVYGAELFPTVCRSMCLGVCTTLCNLGAMISPHVLALDRLLFPRCSFLFHACVCILAAWATTPLPETKDSHGKIPESESRTSRTSGMTISDYVETPLVEHEKS